MNYSVPDELAFFSREFGLSDEHDPNEAIFSYLHTYHDGTELIFTHSPSYNNSVSAKMLEDKEVLFYIYQENVSQIEFQTWGDEKVIRVYFSSKSEVEFRLSYFPKPKLYFSCF